MDQEHKLGTSNEPVEIRYLIRAIMRRFDGHQKIIDELVALEKEQLIEKLMSKRNAAAHADISGKRREISEAELKEMIEDLKVILFRFGNIALNVSSIEEA